MRVCCYSELLIVQYNAVDLGFSQSCNVVMTTLCGLAARGLNANPAGGACSTQSKPTFKLIAGVFGIVPRLTALSD